jgi:hypothetical protein
VGEALPVLGPIFAIGAVPAAYARRRGASRAMTWLIAFFGQSAATGILFLLILTAHDYPAMPRTIGGILVYALPRLLLLSLVTVALVLALIRPVDRSERR